MVDGVLLLVDASEGPAAPDPLRAAQGAGGAAAGDPRGEQGRPARRPHRRGGGRGLRAVPRPRRRRGADRVPDRLHQRQGGLGGARGGRGGHRPRAAAWTCCSSASPRPSTTPPIRCRRRSPTSTPRPTSAGWRSAGCATAACARAADRLVPRRRHGSSAREITELYVTEALDRVEADEAGPGEIIAVAGLPEVTIGETLADPDDPRPLPVITVDEPSLSVVVGHQHLAAGRPGRHRSSPPARCARGSTRSWWATSRSACATPSAPTPGRCRAAASCSWRCWWS